MEDTLYTWGWGSYGQLGHGDEVSQSAPKPFDRVSLQGQVITVLDCGFCYNIGLSARGDVFTWGFGKFAQLGHAENRSNQTAPRKVKFFMKRPVRAVAAGQEHSVAVLTTGEVYTWGSGAFGRLGHGDEENQVEPRLIEYFKNPTVGEGSDVESDGESSHSNMDLDSVEELHPVNGKSKELTPITIVGVACGLHHTLALDSNGQVYSWGLGKSGRLGHGNERDQLFPHLVNALVEQKVEVASVRCGWDHSAVLTKGRGHVFTWGCGRSFQLGGLGLDVSERDFRANPTKVIQWIRKPTSRLNSTSDNRRIPRIVDLDCGGKHNLAVCAEGHIYSWGRGEFGRLGHGDQRHKVYPHLVMALADVKIKQVACGGYHSLALAEDGTVYSWGNNENGRLGLGSTGELSVTKPMPMPASRANKGGYAMKKIFAGAYMSAVYGPSPDQVPTSKIAKCVVQ
mmetsp:Transcript_1612/g.5031  ORF Transcript_1612/g.5031 Transcript_1612/m.5031 type:complete len:454 (-) Transcript_1612:444-1805(-)